MEVIEVERREVAHRAKQRPEAPPRGATVVDCSAVLVESGLVVGAQVVSPEIGDAASRVARAAIAAPEWVWGGKLTAGRRPPRLSGILAPSAFFGFTPPQPLRRRYAAAASLPERQAPEFVAPLRAAARLAGRVFTEACPEAAASNVELVDGGPIPQCWRYEATTWTSGVLNFSTGLPYHRDAGNLKGTWSAMIGAKRRCSGGFLHLAEFDVWLTIPHGSLSFFNGGEHLHGVSGFSLGAAGHRFTAVFYTRQGFRGCASSYEAEAQRGAEAATAAEEARALRLSAR